MGSMINSLDTEILFFIYWHLHFPILDKLMVLITSLGDKGVIWIVIALLLLINKKTRMAGLLTLFALLLTAIIGEVFLKNIFQRPRPCTDFPSMLLLIDRLTSYSFPSGHTSSSFAAAYILSKYFKKYAFFFWTFATLIGLSRIYLFVHYPSDVIAGIVLGLICGKVVTYLYDHYLKAKSLYKSP